MVRPAAPGHPQNSRRGWSATAAGDRAVGRGRIACRRLGSDALPWPDARCSAPAMTRATSRRLRPTPRGNSSRPRKRRQPLHPPPSGPAVHGAGEHGSPVAVARRHRPQPCLFARRADRYRPAPQPGDARRLGTGAAGGDQCRHRARRLSSGADGERDRRLGARRIPVPQQPRSARLHHLQRPGSYTRNSP